MRFKLGGTEAELSFSLLCAAALCAVSGMMKGFLWCVSAILLHEGGHILMMRRLGYFPERIKISLFEITIEDGGRQSRKAYENALIIFFGPFANFICFSLSFLLYLGGMEKLLPFAAANLSVGLFNSLPVLSLDGGQLLYLGLCRRHAPRFAERAVDAATFCCVFPLAVLGFMLLLRSRYNVSLLFVSLYLAASPLLRREHF